MFWSTHTDPSTSISKSRIALSKPNLLHWLGLDYSYHETVNKGHHRREIRARVGSAGQSTASVTSPRAVGGLNYRSDGLEPAATME